MTWSVWIDIFIDKFCRSKGLQPNSISTYREVLRRFEEYVKDHLESKPPNELNLKDVCKYIEYLRCDRGQSNSTINKVVVVIKSFYRCAVSFELISPNEDPTKHLPKMKMARERAGDTLTAKEMNQLANAPDPRTIVGIRDRAMLLLLCTTGIRASECEAIKMMDIDIFGSKIRVTGKGGHQRNVILCDEVLVAIKNYISCRGETSKASNLFRVRTGKQLTRHRIYERVKHYLKKIKNFKSISPHRLRHSFATEMIKNKTNIVVLKEMLGHRCLSSTMRYVKISGEQLREAIKVLEIDTLFEKILAKFPEQNRRYQRPVENTS